VTTPSGRTGARPDRWAQRAPHEQSGAVAGEERTLLGKLIYRTLSMSSELQRQQQAIVP